jgi:hypothetical protein
MTMRDDDLIQGRGRPDPTVTEVIRARQKSRAIVMALLLGAFVILVFAISIAKIGLGYG